MLLAKISRSYHPMRFPWRFDNKQPFALYPVSDSTKTQLAGFEDSFRESYRSLVLAMAKNQLDLIKDYSTSDLFKSIDEAFLIIHNRKQKLFLVNEDSIENINLQLFNERITIFIPKPFIAPVNSMLGMAKQLNEKNERFFAKTMNQPIDIQEREEFQVVFKVDVIFTSPFKLIMVDEAQEVIHGNTSPLPEMHLLQYSAINSPQISENSKSLNSVYNMMKFYKDSFDTTKADWIVSDIDNFLKEA